MSAETQLLNSEHPLSSIGHSKHTFDDFVSLLRQHQIDVVADVRSQPYSKFSPHFTGPNLKPLLLKAQFRYVFLGKELGGRPQGPEFYDPEGFVLYDRLARSQL